MGACRWVVVRFNRSGRPVERYAVLLLLRVEDRWQEVRLFDNTLVVDATGGNAKLARWTRAR